MQRCWQGAACDPAALPGVPGGAGPLGAPKDPRFFRGFVSNLLAASRCRVAACGMCGCARAAAFTRRFHHARGRAARAASAAVFSAPPRAAGSCPFRAGRCLEPPAPLCCCRCHPGSRPGHHSCLAGPSARAPPPRPYSPPPPGAAWTAPGLRRCWHLSG